MPSSILKQPILYLLILSSIGPYFLSEFWVTLFTRVAIMGIFAMSYNLLLGYSGLLSLGQAIYFGVGAYTMSLSLKFLSHSLYLGFLASQILAVVLALVIGFISLRLSGIQFAMVTLAFGEMIHTVALKWRAVTGGDDGITGLPAPVFGVTPSSSASLDTAWEYYYAALILIIITIVILKTIVDSPFGQVIKGARDNATRVEYLGMNVFTTRLMVYVISSLLSATAGALYAPFLGVAYPSSLSWASSADPVLMTILGGSNMLLGPLFGSLIYILVEYLIKSFLTDYWMLVFGTILIFSVIVFPKGLLPAINLKKLKKWEEGVVKKL